jgi:hypothetical protein
MNRLRALEIHHGNPASGDLDKFRRIYGRFDRRKNCSLRHGKRSASPRDCGSGWRVTKEGGIQVPPENGVCQLQVFVDGGNDRGLTSDQNCDTGLMWATSVLYSEEPKPRTWHWIEKA